MKWFVTMIWNCHGVYHSRRVKTKPRLWFSLRYIHVDAEFYSNKTTWVLSTWCIASPKKVPGCLLMYKPYRSHSLKLTIICRVKTQVSDPFPPQITHVEPHSHWSDRWLYPAPQSPLHGHSYPSPQTNSHVHYEVSRDCVWLNTNVFALFGSPLWPPSPS